MSKTTNKYSPEVRERAVRMVLDNHGQHESRWAAILSIVGEDRLCGADAERVGQEGRGRQRQAGRRHDRDGRAAEGAGTREPGAAAGQRDPAQGVGVFCSGGARPPIRSHDRLHRRSPRGASGSSRSAGNCRSPRPPIYDHLAKRADPDRLSDRAKRDAELRPEIERVFEENCEVYGVRKVWQQMRREGFDVARCTVARLMKDMGLQGVIRGKPHQDDDPATRRSHARWTR